jgi:hypothetical protein
MCREGDFVKVLADGMAYRKWNRSKETPLSVTAAKVSTHLFFCEFADTKTKRGWPMSYVSSMDISLPMRVE